MTQLADYYRDRAAEYDAVYAKPERQGTWPGCVTCCRSWSQRTVIVLDDRYVPGRRATLELR